MVATSAGYLLSDVIEAAQDGFSTGQLVLTLICEALIPFLVLGIYAAQRPAIGRLGRWSAFAYAAAYVVFTGSVVYALVKDTPDYDSLSDALGLWMIVPGILMLLSGIGFGVAVVRAGVLPAWTGWALAAGVVLVVATQGAPEIPSVIAAGVRAAAWAGMGYALAAGPPKAET
jgi:hypothetical protein